MRDASSIHQIPHRNNGLGKPFKKAVADLVFQGLKFGVHLVVAAQEFSKIPLGRCAGSVWCCEGFQGQELA